LTAEETPSITSEDGLIKINIHSGELNGVKGPVQTFSPVNTFTVYAQKGGKSFFSLPKTHNAFIYLLNGKAKIAGDSDEIEGHYVVILNNDGEGFELEALEDARLMIGTGEPLNEPVASHGPFVMNNQTEVMEAFRDYEMSKMGVLIED
jgi:quercetin 2,3-dioxygenase